MNLINHDYMRVKNLSNVFELIRSSEGLLTKRELQNKSGLCWSTISDSVAELIKNGFIVDAEFQTSKVGRPAKTYDINPNNNLLIGVDINPESYRAVVIDMQCRVIYSTTRMMVDNDRESVIASAKAIIYDVISQSGINIESVLGIGFALTGVVDTVNGVSLYSHHYKNWDNVPIKEIFEEEFQIPVLIEHDPNCLAIAELNIGIGKNYNHIILIRSSFGIGMSFLIDGKIYTGSAGHAGEFGHICIDRKGPQCLCGRRGCLEAYSSISGIAQRYRETMEKKGVIFSERNSNADFMLIQKLANLAATGDEDALFLFDKAADTLGYSIGNLISVLAPDIVILGGRIVDYSPLYGKKLTETALDICWPHHNAKIVFSTLKANATAIGAASLFIQSKIWETKL